jgi:hypothetical protein
MTPTNQAMVQTPDDVWSARKQLPTRRVAQRFSQWPRLTLQFFRASITHGAIAALALGGLVALAQPAAAAEGVAPERELAELRLRQVDASIFKCLSVLVSVESNEALDKKLLSIAKKPGQERFVTSRDLADIEEALGFSTGLTDADLERCIAAVDVQAKIAARTGTTAATPVGDCGLGIVLA